MITIDEMTIYCLYLWYFIPPIRFCTAPISPCDSTKPLPIICSTFPCMD